MEQPVPGAAAGTAKPAPTGESPVGAQPPQSLPSDTPDPHTLFQLQELPWQWNRGDSPELLGEAEDQSASGSEGESPEGRGWELQGAQGASSWGGGTCHQSWGWGNVLTSANGQYGQSISSHLGTGWHWAAWGGTWEEGAGKGSQVSASVPTRSVAGCSHWCPLSSLCFRTPVDTGTTAAAWFHPA